MKLPNADRAVVDIRKLRDYCLDPNSPKGRNKARVFKAALGLTRADAEFLRKQLLVAAREADCQLEEADDYGRRYSLDFPLEVAARRHQVRSGWIVRHDEDFPRLTTCYVIVSKTSRR
jgi:hypothetical protein